MINPILAGWMHYYGRFYRSALYPLLRPLGVAVLGTSSTRGSPRV
jgi:RNA-directed DNA polymerase